MKQIIIFCLLLTSVAVRGQYNPSTATVTNKPLGIAQAVPTDARSYYYDASLFIWRPYQSTAEALSYLNLTKYRIGQFSIIVNEGGSLQSNGSFVGGTIKEYWFKDGTSNSNLLLKDDAKSVTVAQLRALNTQSGSTYITSDYGGGTWLDIGVDNTISDNLGAFIKTANNHVAKRIYSGNINATWFGDLNTASNLQNAINYASSVNSPIYIPAGTYNITPVTSVTSEAGATTVAYVMKSNMHLTGVHGKTIFRVADNVSTDESPKSMAMFFTNDTLSNVSFDGITFDMNGQNNKISPNRPTTYNRYDQSPIYVSGTPGGVGAKIDNVLINGCTFQNNPGVCNIVVAQSNTPGVVLGSGWVITNNLFYNNGLDTDDHTGIFAWANNVVTDNNRFINPTKFRSIGLTGGNTAYEIHGANHTFSNNYVKNYYRGIWVSSNYTSETTNAFIYHNRFDSVLFYGVDLFRTLLALKTIKGVKIDNNFIDFNDSTYTNGAAPTQKAAINITPEYAVNDIEITNNTATKTGTNIGSAFTTVSPQTVAGQSFNNIRIEGNKATGFVSGTFIRTNGTNGLGYVSIKNNQWINNTPSTIFTVPIGNFIDAPSAIKTLDISGNTDIDNRTTPLFQYANYLSGIITDLHYSANTETYKGLVGTPHNEASLTVTNRSGQELDLNAFQLSGNQSATGVKTLNGSSPLIINSTTTTDGKLLFTNLSNTAGWNAGLSGSTSGDYVLFNRTNSLSAMTIAKGTNAVSFAYTVSGADAVSSNQFQVKRIIDSLYGVSFHLAGTQSATGVYTFNGSVPIVINSTTATDSKLLFTNSSNTQGFNVGLSGATTGDFVIANRTSVLSSLTIAKSDDHATFIGRVSGANAISANDFITLSQNGLNRLKSDTAINSASTTTRGRLQNGLDSLGSIVSSRILTGSAVLDFPSTTFGSSSDLTVSVTGAILSDPVSLGIANVSITTTAKYTAWVSAANTVTVRFIPNATEDPPSGTFKVAIFH